jgi:hypothetical protein
MERVHALFSACAVIAWLAVASITGAGAVQLIPPGLSALTPAGELLVNFDDNGNATMAVNGSPPAPLTGSLMADPACSGSCPPALTYLLPESVVSGDVAILDPASLGGGVNDWLRFTDDIGNIDGTVTGDGSRMIFYSMFGLADVPFPANIGSENFVIGPTAVVSDGTISFDYQPGGVPYPENNEYIGIIHIHQVAIPEPASLGLLAAYLAAAGIIVRRRQGRSRVAQRNCAE